MCVAIVRFEPGSRCPVVVGFNRDERPERDAAMPAVFEYGGRRILAAREPLHGGTWLGVNDAGLVVGLLNRTEPSSENAAARSRGLLVLDCLTRPNVHAVEAFLARLAHRYNPFNLFALDRDAALAATSDGVRTAVMPLTPGTHVFAHGDPDDRHIVKVARVHDAIGQAAGEPEAFIAAVRQCLTSHAGGSRVPRPVLSGRAAREPPNTPAGQDRPGHTPGDDPTSDASPCRHGGGYRTLCSTLLAVEGGSARGGRLLHAPGPPCATPYADLSALLAGLLVSGPT